MGGMSHEVSEIVPLSASEASGIGQLILVAEDNVMSYSMRSGDTFGKRKSSELANVSRDYAEDECVPFILL